ncbi:unnamed protein product, partial [Meganyctiphanes norvegica]
MADICQSLRSLVIADVSLRPVRPQLMSSYPKTMEAYQKARAMGTSLEEVMGDDWKSFVERPHLVAWMSGHCRTHSRREEYIRELQKYIELDIFGTCGKKMCARKGSHLSSWCWENILRPNYLFYMAMENSLCQDYLNNSQYLAIIS